MISLSVESVESESVNYAEGYVGAVLSKGVPDQNVVRIEITDYLQIRRRYYIPDRAPPEKVGTELKKLISKFGLHPAPNCKCSQHINEMNQKGVEWCSQNIHTIVHWLREEAQRAKLPFAEIGAKILVKRAIHNAKKKLTPAATA